MQRGKCFTDLNVMQLYLFYYSPYNLQICFLKRHSNRETFSYLLFRIVLYFKIALSHGSKDRKCDSCKYEVFFTLDFYI